MVRHQGVGTGGHSSLRALGELSAADASFEELERIISSDVGLSLKLLRYVNSAFFALPRHIGSVREALTLLGTRTVRRWATVMAMSAVPGAPHELVAIALHRARMCEMLAGSASADDRETLFTIGLFSVADGLMDMTMEEVLETLPFADEIRAALLRHEGPKGELLAAVLAYERGEFPSPPSASPGDGVARRRLSRRPRMGGRGRPGDRLSRGLTASSHRSPQTTRRAPAALSARAHASSVEPVVWTSSTSSTVGGAARTCRSIVARRRAAAPGAGLAGAAVAPAQRRHSGASRRAASARRQRAGRIEPAPAQTTATARAPPRPRRRAAPAGSVAAMWAAIRSATGNDARNFSAWTIARAVSS